MTARSAAARLPEYGDDGPVDGGPTWPALTMLLAGVLHRVAGRGPIFRAAVGRAIDAELRGD